MEGVSFIVTVYNKEKYLPYTIASLLAQEGDFEREFIFIDDGSTDKSVFVIQELFKHTPFKPIIISQINQGPAQALNAGFKIASMPIIKPMDGDDILHPSATILLYQALCNSTCVAIVGESGMKGYSFNDDPMHVFKSLPPLKQDNTVMVSVRRILKRNISNPTGLLFRRETIAKMTKGHFDACFQDVFIQDYGLELRLALFGGLALLLQPIIGGPCDTTDEKENHLSSNQAQTIHDLNAALACAVEAYGKTMLPKDLKFAYQRATGRSYSWSRRHEKVPCLLSKETWYFLRARFTPSFMMPLTEKDFWQTTKTFSRTHFIKSNKILPMM